MGSCIRHLIFVFFVVAYGYCLWYVHGLIPHPSAWDNATTIMVLLTAYIGGMAGWAGILRIGRA